MNHCLSEQVIQEYLDGEVTGEQASNLAEHIRCCPRCQRLYQGLKTISQTLAKRPQPLASARLSHRILEAVGETAPVRPITCKAAQRLISPYLDAELSPLEQQRLQAHLFTCTECYPIFKQAEQITTALRQAPPVTVPAWLGERVHSAVREAAASEPEVIGYVGRRISWRTAGAMAAAVAAAAVIVFGLVLAPHRVRTPEVPDIAIVVEPPATPASEELAEDTGVEAVEIVEGPGASAAPYRIATPYSPARRAPERETPPPRPTVTPAPGHVMEGPELAALPPRGARPADMPGPTTVAPGPAIAPADTSVVPESPTPAALTPVEEPEPGPRIVLIPPSPVEVARAPGPELAVVPGEPTYTPVRSDHRPVYRNDGPVVDAARLAEAGDKLNDRVALLKASSPRAWTVVK